MRKLIYLFVGAIFITGCSSVSGLSTVNREHLLRLSQGMTKKEALRIMGRGTMRVFDGPMISKTINNPYISEIIQGKDKTFEVIYYVTSDRDIDSNTPITDEDLTPLVFDHDQLIGWGKNFLKDIEQKNEIKPSVVGEEDKSKKSKKSMSFGKKKK